MFGLSIFMTAVFTITPLLIEVYQERVTLKEESIAISLCHNALQEWVVSREEPGSDHIVGGNRKVYNVSWVRKDEAIEICIDWMGTNGRNRSVCGETK
jgi:hypothetical protein